MKKIKDIYCFYGDKPKFDWVGLILTEIENMKDITKEDVVYISPRNSITKHYFRNFLGYGLSVLVYNQLIQNKVTKVILMIEKSKFLLSNLCQWKRANKWINETLDGQIDNQYILKEEKMIELKGGEQEMVNVKDFIKASGNFLSAKDVNAQPNVPFIIISEGKIIKSEKFQTEKLQIEGEFNKVQKTFDLSKTNARVIAEKLGEETKTWIGHQLILETYKTKTSDGKLTDAINVKEVK